MGNEYYIIIIIMLVLILFAENYFCPSKKIKIKNERFIIVINTTRNTLRIDPNFQSLLTMIRFSGGVPEI